MSLLSVGLFLAGLTVAGYLLFKQFLGSGVSTDKTLVVFEVVPNQSLKSVAESLNSQKLVKSSWLFYNYAKIKGTHSKLKSGEYALHQAMTPDEIIAVITSGKSIPRQITVIEGATIFDVAQAIEKSGLGTKDDFLNLIKDKEYIKNVLNDDVPTLEGYLFPETYQFTKYDGVKEITGQMVKHFLMNWEKVAAEAKLKNMTRKKLITLASIVEKETGRPEDRPLVASVFQNRLQKGMKLQTDPTILYGLAMERWSLGLKPEMPTNITKKDILKPTKYNTYVINGLPPAPISNPGLRSIQAVLNPASSSFLYFVSRNDGTTYFSDSLSKHNVAVKMFQTNSKAREGKSWRDLNKKNTVDPFQPPK